MVFSSPIFLFGFLPLVLLFYYASPSAIKNTVLLLASLAFYAWGEVFYVAVMLVSIVSNYIVGNLIEKAQENERNRLNPGAVLAVGIACNLVLLISFKYANFIADNLNALLSRLNAPEIDLAPIHLPLGISFFTFQAMSYIVDVYRKESRAQNNIFDLALYISLFPQLIAGPIVRYHDVASQILDRTHSIAMFSSGVQRFVIGLAKKMLIANPLGEVADNVFILSAGDLTMQLAWIGIIAYTLQIYFDFSGYSDMAIGLGRMFGFRFLENFNYPYISRSIREFWRRWHISLSTWFRDYVYIPLGGSRVSTSRVYLNLLLVFFLTGFWHGASWNFLAWGMFHGLFLAGEHAGFCDALERAWRPLQHMYVASVVIVSWVLFRSETLSEAVDYLSAMANIENWTTSQLQFSQVLSAEFFYALVFSLMFCLPIYPWLKTRAERFSKSLPGAMMLAANAPRVIVVSALLWMSILKVSSSTYNPFIYFRF